MELVFYFGMTIVTGVVLVKYARVNIAELEKYTRAMFLWPFFWVALALVGIINLPGYIVKAIIKSKERR